MEWQRVRVVTIEGGWIACGVERDTRSSVWARERKEWHEAALAAHAAAQGGTREAARRRSVGTVMEAVLAVAGREVIGGRGRGKREEAGYRWS